MEFFELKFDESFVGNKYGDLKKEACRKEFSGNIDKKVKELETKTAPADTTQVKKR